MNSTPELAGEGKRQAGPRYRGISVFDRDLRAETAATLIRKGLSAVEVCARLSMSRSALLDLGRDYDFRVPGYEPGNWPDRDEPGDPTPSWRPRAISRRRIAQSVAVAVDPWPAQPPPVFYDHCAASTATAKTGADIIRDVCAKHGLSKDALLGKHRRRDLCAARHEAAFRMVVELGFSYPKAGRVLGGRDHTTILNSVKRHASADQAAGIAYREYCAALDRSEDVLRAQVIHLHFEEGCSVVNIVKRLATSRVRIMGWLLEEADRRRVAA